MYAPVDLGSQMFFESTVSCECFLFLKESLLLYLVVNSFSAIPMSVGPCVTRRCCDSCSVYGVGNVLGIRHAPSRGQRFFFLQLHFFLSEASSFSLRIF